MYKTGDVVTDGEHAGTVIFKFGNRIDIKLHNGTQKQLKTNKLRLLLPSKIKNTIKKKNYDN